MLKSLFGPSKNDPFNQALEQFRKLIHLSEDNEKFMNTALEVIRLCQLAIQKNKSDGDAHVLLANTYYLAALTILGGGYTYCLPRAAAVIYEWKIRRFYTKNWTNGDSIYQDILEAIEHPKPGWTNMPLEGDIRDMHNRLYHEAINPDSMIELKKILTTAHLAQTEKRTNDANTHILSAVWYKEQGRLDEAIQTLQGGLRLNPDNAELHYLLGTLYEEQERWDEAVLALQTVQRIDPNHPTVHFPLGVAYLRSGQLDQAVQEFQAGLNIDPNNAVARNLLGRSYQRQGRLDEAIRECQIALQFDPDSFWIHFMLGELYAEQGRLDEAIRELQAGLYLDPNNGDAHFMLGKIYEHQGHKDKAVRELQIAASLGVE